MCPARIHSPLWVRYCFVALLLCCFFMDPLCSATHRFGLDVVLSCVVFAVACLCVLSECISSGTELSFRLPIDATATFPAMLRSLDAQKRTLGIAEYGLSVTTVREMCALHRLTARTCCIRFICVFCLSGFEFCRWLFCRWRRFSFEWLALTDAR